MTPFRRGLLQSHAAYLTELHAHTIMGVLAWRPVPEDLPGRWQQGQKEKKKKSLIQHANDEIPHVAVVHLSVLLIRRNLGLQQSRVVRFLTATYNNKQQQD